MNTDPPHGMVAAVATLGWLLCIGFALVSGAAIALWLWAHILH